MTSMYVCMYACVCVCVCVYSHCPVLSSLVQTLRASSRLTTSSDSKLFAQYRIKFSRHGRL